MGQTVPHRLVGRGSRRRVGHKVIAMREADTSDHGAEQSDADAASDVPHEAVHGGNLVVLLARHADVRQRVLRNKNKRESERLVGAQHGRGSKVHAEADVRGHVIQRSRNSDEAEGHHGARVHPCHQHPGDRHHEHHHDSASGKGFSRLYCRIAHLHLQILRDHDRRAVEHCSQHKTEEHRRGEIAPLKHADVHDGVRVVPFPHDPHQEGIRGHDGQAGDPRRGEPIRLLALVENDLQARDRQCDQPQTDIVG